MISRIGEQETTGLRPETGTTHGAVPIGSVVAFEDGFLF